LKRLTLSNIEWVNKEFRKFGASFLEEDFLKEYRFEGGALAERSSYGGISRNLRLKV